MTRIIAGAAGSVTLAVPDAGTRPTSDRVRESLFGALEAADRIAGAAVLDLFAGSGALGLEAISRGAASADLVELAPKAAAVARRNVAAVARAVPVAVSVHRSAAEAFLKTSGARYDLVFLDPPYDLGAEALSVTLTLLVPRLLPGALVIIERSRRSEPPTLPPELTPVRERSYGDTTLWWVEASGGH